MDHHFTRIPVSKLTVAYSCLATLTNLLSCQYIPPPPIHHTTSPEILNIIREEKNKLPYLASRQNLRYFALCKNGICFLWYYHRYTICHTTKPERLSQREKKYFFLLPTFPTAITIYPPSQTKKYGAHTSTAPKFSSAHTNSYLHQNQFTIPYKKSRERLVASFKT